MANNPGKSLASGMFTKTQNFASDYASDLKNNTLNSPQIRKKYNLDDRVLQLHLNTLLPSDVNSSSNKDVTSF